MRRKLELIFCSMNEYVMASEGKDPKKAHFSGLIRWLVGWLDRWLAADSRTILLVQIWICNAAG